MTRAAITGVGAVSGFGDGLGALWEGLAAGRRALRRSPALAAAGLPELVALAPGEDPLGPGDRATPMALRAVREASADAGGLAAGEWLSVSVGTTLGGIGAWLDRIRDGRARAEGWRWSGPAGAIAAAIGAEGEVLTTSVACASGNRALGEALRLIREGRALQVVAGGVDTLSDFVLAGFASLKALDPEPCRPFDRSRRGLNLGEGACFLIVEAEDHARARGARIRAFLDGHGAACDAHHMTGPDREGRGAARAIAAALADGRAGIDEVGYVSAHGTATPFNDAMEAKALRRVFGERASRLPLSSIKSGIGHTLGAAGALEAALCVRVLEAQLVPPTAGYAEPDPEIALDVVAGEARAVRARTVLSTSSGFGGVNSSIVLRASSR